MGQIPKLASTVLCMLLILPLTSCSSTKAPSSNQEGIIVYLHDYSGRHNATVVPVVGISAAPSAGSRVIGRAQGILVINSLDGSSMQMLLSIVFSDGVGSTLQIQGTTRQSDRVREVSIVSGTKYYRFARGYAVLETLIYDPETSYAMVLCNITLLPT
ncbi:hypothetical protein QQ045_018201 [Rhodiola kirilowii]